MNIRITAIVAAVILTCSGAFAACGSCGTDEKPADTAKAAAANVNNAATVKVNNTVCPVSGDKVDMQNPTTIDYKSERYNLCCPACIAEFNRAPEKYSAKAKEQSK